MDLVLTGGRMSNDQAEAARGAGRERRRLSRSIKELLRDVGAQLSRLNHEVSGRVNIRTSDLECLDQIDREGPLSPTSLARLTGQHPATLTGILATGAVLSSALSAHGAPKFSGSTSSTPA